MCKQPIVLRSETGRQAVGEEPGHLYTYEKKERKSLRMMNASSRMGMGDTRQFLKRVWNRLIAKEL
jgi:hypothetical protein